MRGIVKLLALIFIFSLSVKAADYLDNSVEAPKKTSLQWFMVKGK